MFRSQLLDLHDVLEFLGMPPPSSERPTKNIVSLKGLFVEVRRCLHLFCYCIYLWYYICSRHCRLGCVHYTSTLLLFVGKQPVLYTGTRLQARHHYQCIFVS